jgi:hypothetical protein
MQCLIPGILGQKHQSNAVLLATKPRWWKKNKNKSGNAKTSVLSSNNNNNK